jgi:peptidoglycan/xylan/chitin deacetylase (PgdA/CDA1 family)
MSAIVHAPVATRWRPSRTVAASMILHAAAIVAVIVGPAGTFWWALAAVAANHGFMGALGLWPRSTWLGPNFTRLPQAAAARGEIALTFDDGPDPEVTPRVLDLLEAHGARATFFCIAERAVAAPELAREIVRRGHLVENHSRAHRATFPMLGLGGIRREIAAAQASLGDITGHAPRFFRPPAGLRNPLLDPVLHDLGLRLVSWTRRGYDTNRSNADEVGELLLRGLGAGDILLMHDGHSARTAHGEPVVLEVLPRVLEAIRAASLKPVTLAQAIDA